MEQQNSDLRLHEGELNVMELLWSYKVLAAKDISKIIPFREKYSLYFITEFRIFQ